MQDRLKNDEELQRTYNLSRNEQDTAKAIYRLTTLGIVDDYTIDFQNKCFVVKCSRKRDGYYLAELEKLIARYSSTTDARHMVARFESQHKESGQSEMRFCLARLTDFVYDKIARKRELAMADMVRLCQNALVIKDPIEQSEAVKSEIYYYFNAKYSRPQNNAIVDGGESMPACLPAERDSDIYEVTRRYIRFADGDTTGSFKNNLKHLRGAAQRTIRSYEHFTAAYFLPRLLPAHSKPGNA